MVVPVAAFPAGPVPGGQAGGFVQEVQLGQPPRHPLLPAPALEREHADRPGVPAGIAGPPALASQQNAAVAPELSTSWHVNYSPARCSPILPWHGKPPRHQLTFSRPDVA